MFKISVMVLVTSILTGCNLLSIKDQSYAQKSFDESLNKYKYTVIKSLENKEYKKIIQYLENLDISSKTTPADELKLDYEINSLGSTRRNYDHLLTEMIEKNSSSYIAWLLRAHYYQGKAWQERGNAYIQQVSNTRIDGMNYYKGKALSDINKALELNSNSVNSLLLKAQIHIITRGEKDKAMSSFVSALKIMPQSYSVRNILLHNSTPRWGGSIHNMEQIISDARRYYNVNPYLKNLESTIIEERADEAMRSDTNVAINLYKKAIEVGDRDRPRTDLAELLLRRGKTEEACLHLNKAIQLNPPRWFSHELMNNCK